MSSYESPWAQFGEDLFDKFIRHWPHYQTLSFTFSLSWSASRSVTFPETACPEATRTDVSEGSCGGTITWTRQSEDDENSEQTLAANAFRMRITFIDFVSETPRIDSALFHYVGRGSFTNPTGSWEQTIYTGDACDIIETTTSGTVTSDVTVAGVGVYESGTNEWFATAEAGVTFSSAPSPISIPSLQDYFLTDIEGPPGGATLTFSASGTNVTPADGWTGSASLSYTLTLST